MRDVSELLIGHRLVKMYLNKIILPYRIRKTEKFWTNSNLSGHDIIFHCTDLTATAISSWFSKLLTTLLCIAHLLLFQ